jgi:hypothetical protein
MRVLLCFALSLCCTTTTIAAERIRIEAKINGIKICFAFDTGTPRTMLFGRTARRLNLKVTEQPPNAETKHGYVRPGLSEECRVELGNDTNKVRFSVLELPKYMDTEIDGLLSWPTIRNTILRINADSKTKKISPLESLPKDIGLWTKWNIRKDSGYLEVKLPLPSGKDGTILIDTGSPFGVALSPQRWKQWLEKHKDQPASVEASYQPGVGVRATDLFWASRLTIGDFSLKDVPVAKAPPHYTSVFANYQATVGLFALTRLDIIVDGKNSSLYTRPHSKPISKYQYNRLGAVFVPANKKSEHLVAHVAKKSPADRAGVRNGDVLMRVGDLDVTKWRTDPKVLPLSRFWDQPAGNKLKLSLMRDGKLLKIIVELEEIFAKDAKASKIHGKDHGGQPNAPADAKRPRR